MSRLKALARERAAEILKAGRLVLGVVVAGEHPLALLLMEEEAERWRKHARARLANAITVEGYSVDKPAARRR